MGRGVRFDDAVIHAPRLFSAARLCVVCVSVAGCESPSGLPEADPWQRSWSETPWSKKPSSETIRGVAWQASRNPVAQEELDALRMTHVNAIVQMPFASLPDPHGPEIHWQGTPRGWWGEREEGIASLANSARERGIASWLKPHLWIDQSWPGAVEMRSEADWREWFGYYRGFLLHWADFAESQELAGLCIGSELDRSLGHESEWRALIAEVREHYTGPLLYAANWNQVERVPFWDALDAIGVNAYFPLTRARHPQVDELVAAWEPIRRRLQALAMRHGRPVLFTEIGYHPIEAAFTRPYDWNVGAAAFDPEAQANGYEAVARVFYDEPWFGGIFWWTWQAAEMRPLIDAEFERRHPAARTSTYSPQGLPAEEVLRRTFESLRQHAVAPGFEDGEASHAWRASPGKH